MRNVPVGGWGRGVCVCVLCWLKKKKKGEQEWKWSAKERKVGVDCVMGRGVRWGARGKQQSDFFFLLFNWWDVPKPLEHPVWQNMTFHIPSHPTIYILLYPQLKRAFRENFERETLEKTRLTHPQSLPKRLFKYLYSFPLHCQTLERLITKTFSHHIHLCERAVWCFRKQLRRNQFHIGWCYGQVAKSGMLEKK